MVPMNLLRINEKALIGLGLVAAGVDLALFPVTFGDALPWGLAAACPAALLLLRPGRSSRNFGSQPGPAPRPAWVPVPAVVPGRPVRR